MQPQGRGFLISQKAIDSAKRIQPEGNWVLPIELFLENNTWLFAVEKIIDSALPRMDRLPPINVEARIQQLIDHYPEVGVSTLIQQDKKVEQNTALVEFLVKRALEIILFQLNMVYREALANQDNNADHLAMLPSRTLEKLSIQMESEVNGMQYPKAVESIEAAIHQAIVAMMPEKIKENAQHYLQPEINAFEKLPSMIETLKTAMSTNANLNQAQGERYHQLEQLSNALISDEDILMKIERSNLEPSSIVSNMNALIPSYLSGEYDDEKLKEQFMSQLSPKAGHQLGKR
jgi:hypothetical protein